MVNVIAYFNGHSDCWGFITEHETIIWRVINNGGVDTY